MSKRPVVMYGHDDDIDAFLGNRRPWWRIWCRDAINQMHIVRLRSYVIYLNAKETWHRWLG